MKRTEKHDDQRGGILANTKEKNNMKITISNERAIKKQGWNCHYNRSNFWFKAKREAVACARSLTKDDRHPFTASVRPVKNEDI